MPGKYSTKPPIKANRIVADLRRQIVSGQWRPGTCLPTRHQLRDQFDASTMTVQRAVDRLIADEFLHAKAGHGTYVADHPPHLCTYGLVFPHLYIDSRFLRAVRAAARIVFNSDARRVRHYECESNNADAPATRRLLDDMARRCLTGVILVWTMGEYNETAIYSPDCDIPRVAIGSDIDVGAPPLLMDMTRFYERAVERLIARGRRKIAHIGVGDDKHMKGNRSEPRLGPILKRHGLEYRRRWDLTLGAACSFGARAAAELLLSLPAEDRPDGLIVGDDNFVENAQAGIVDARVRVPEDVDVIVHCNWPEPPAKILSLTRLGFDTVAMMRTCAELIDGRRGSASRRASSDAAAPQAIYIHPVFEDELPAESVERVGDR